MTTSTKKIMIAIVIVILAIAAIMMLFVALRTIGVIPDPDPSPEISETPESSPSPDDPNSDPEGNPNDSSPPPQVGDWEPKKPGYEDGRVMYDGHELDEKLKAARLSKSEIDAAFLAEYNAHYRFSRDVANITKGYMAPLYGRPADTATRMTAQQAVNELGTTLPKAQNIHYAKNANGFSQKPGIFDFKPLAYPGTNIPAAERPVLKLGFIFTKDEVGGLIDWIKANKSKAVASALIERIMATQDANGSVTVHVYTLIGCWNIIDRYVVISFVPKDDPPPSPSPSPSPNPNPSPSPSPGPSPDNPDQLPDPENPWYPDDPTTPKYATEPIADGADDWSHIGKQENNQDTSGGAQPIIPAPVNPYVPPHTDPPPTVTAPNSIPVIDSTPQPVQPGISPTETIGGSSGGGSGGA